jgi:hypothetical protein
MIIELAKDENRQNELKKNIGALAIKDADRRIATKCCDPSEYRFAAMPLSLRRGLWVRPMRIEELQRSAAIHLSDADKRIAEETINTLGVNRVSMIGPTNTVLMNTPFGGAGSNQCDSKTDNTIEYGICIQMNDEIKKIRSVYFIGIGGIGMSAVARFFNSKGIQVSGYDRSATTLTEELKAEGIAVHYEENVELIPKNVDLVVYTPAVPKDHRELVFYQQNGYRTVKRSDVLQMITGSSFISALRARMAKQPLPL